MNHPESFLNGRVTLHAGDSREVLKTIADNSIDSIVTDPPYNLNFMGKQWDTGETAFAVEFWQQCLRVLKPGGHVVAFSGTRTYHRMACAIEDAGFEIRDQLQWVYGSGFPKSHDVSKHIDRHLGAKREKKTVPVRGHATMAKWAVKNGAQANHWQSEVYGKGGTMELNGDIAATASALQWQGWGTALKPACEPICFARKPLSEKTVAANVLAHGVGAINIDGCRVEHVTVYGGNLALNPHLRNSINGGNGGQIFPTEDARRIVTPNASGRWPANLLHDGSDEVLAGFPETQSGSGFLNPKGAKGDVTKWRFEANDRSFDGDSGSAARFFYTSKADADDRLGSKHPTVKPLDLMQWLCRLVTPPGGTILDCFAGTGTTGEAAYREGFNCVLIEREAEYQADIRRRMGLVLSGPDERARESIKARLKDTPVDHGPLFGGLDPIAEAAE